MCVLYVHVLIYSGQALLIHITSDQADQLLYNSLAWFFSQENGYSHSTKTGNAHLAHTLTIKYMPEMCLCVSAASHTSLWLHVVQCHQVAFSVSRRLTVFSFSITHAHTVLTAPQRCLDPKKPLRLRSAVLAKQYQLCVCVLVPAAPYPTTKHCFVSMLLYASIESHCNVQLTNTKAADS